MRDLLLFDIVNVQILDGQPYNRARIKLRIRSGKPVYFFILSM